MNNQKKTCPSARCEPNTKLIGIVNPAGTVDILAHPFPVTHEFVEESLQVGQSEKRFRFANTCAQSGCNQWSSGSCGVIKKVMEALNTKSQDEDLPACGVRKTCRWYFQEGKKACQVCPLIITDNYTSQ